MTFTYSSQVSTVKLLGLPRLLRIWRASVYKLVFREILIFMLLYFTVSCVYRLALNDAQKKMFERLVVYSGTSESLLPVTFVLGFYVSVVVQRWWSQFMNIGWPDRIMAYISVLVTGNDDQSRMMRRTMIRYLMLSEVLLLMNMSVPVKKRFPDLESVVKQGLMTRRELKLYTDERAPHIAAKYWIPCQWCAVLMGRARQENRIKDSFELIKLLEELTEYKNCLKAIFSYDWVCLPLVYTQVATVAVYAFFFTAIISRQFVDYHSVRTEFDEDTSARFAVDMYVPLEAIMQLFFYLGWLKVAEQMLNPFGEDDDDFECNFIIDRNLKVGLFSVDRMLTMQPELERDVWWDSIDPQLRYTEASERFAMPAGWFGSTADLSVSSPTHPAAAAAAARSLKTIPEAGGGASQSTNEILVVSEEMRKRTHANHKRGRRRSDTTSSSMSGSCRTSSRKGRLHSSARMFGSTPDARFSPTFAAGISPAESAGHPEFDGLIRSAEDSTA